MKDAVSQNQPSCPQADVVAAYLDGELDIQASQIFDRHAGECALCAAALNEQKRLLCALDAAFGQRRDKDFVLPNEFARVVAAHARTDMSGLRRKSERRRAFVVSLLLAVPACVLLGASFFDEALAPFAGFARAIAGVGSLFGHALGDALTGAAVILRALGGRLVSEPHPARFLTLALFACALVLLHRLIGSYHRARVRE